MSRSRKKPIIKDGPRNYKKSSAYWRPIRRVIKERVKYLNEALEDEQLPIPQEIINDYDYSDYRFDIRNVDDPEMAEKESRK